MSEGAVKRKRSEVTVAPVKCELPGVAAWDRPPRKLCKMEIASESEDDSGTGSELNTEMDEELTDLLKKTELDDD